MSAGRMMICLLHQARYQDSCQYCDDMRRNGERFPKFTTEELVLMREQFYAREERREYMYSPRFWTHCFHGRPLGTCGMAECQPDER
jgi:hypothetical protein